MGYTFRLAARVLLYASSHRQDNTYHSLCYTSRGALAGTRNSTVKDRSDDPSHHERMLLPRSYISLPVGDLSHWALSIHWLLHRVIPRDIYIYKSSPTLSNKTFERSWSRISWSTMSHWLKYFHLIFIILYNIKTFTFITSNTQFNIFCSV